MASDTVPQSHWRSLDAKTILHSTHKGYIPVHRGRLQCCLCTCRPLHSSPPPTGGGLLHILLLTLIPNPHVAEQVPKSDQGPQFPGTAMCFHRCKLKTKQYEMKFYFGERERPDLIKPNFNCVTTFLSNRFKL